MERLQKVMAHAGIASRRAAERMIRDGRVSVNGTVVTELGTRVDPALDAVKIDGKRLPTPPKTHTYLLLNKPRGYVTTLSDPEKRPTVRHLLAGVAARVYPVGRLDFDSEGLLLLTDDGDLARDLMHPSSGVPKTYLAKVRGTPDAAALERIARGVRIEGRATLPARARITRRGDNSWLEVTVIEGRNRQVRRMLEAVGHPVQRLRRTVYAGISLGALPSGAFRHLTPSEVSRLRKAIQPRSPEPRRGRGPGRS